MKRHISPAIIMRIKEFGESDLLVSFFTSDRGRLKGVAKGARRSRRRFVNALDTFSLVNIEYELKRSEDLHFLHSSKIVDVFPGLRSDYGRLARASFMIELTEILFPAKVADGGMFELLKGSFHLLDRGDRADTIPVLFEFRAMTLGGYGINFEECFACGRPYKGEGRAVFKREKGQIACLKCERESALSPGLDPETVRLIKVMQSRSLNALKDLELKNEILTELKPVLRLHREYQLGKRPKTAAYLD